MARNGKRRKENQMANNFGGKKAAPFVKGGKRNSNSPRTAKGLKRRTGKK